MDITKPFFQGTQGQEKSEHEKWRAEIGRKKFGLLCVACVLPVLIVSSRFGYKRGGLGVSECAIVIAIAAREFWNLRRDYRYWTVLALGLVMQIPLVLLVPWDKMSKGEAVLGIMLPDYAFVCVSLWLVKRTIAGTRDVSGLRQRM